MFDKIIKAIEPFGLTTIILAGASMAGWIDFSNDGLIGIIVVGFGILLVLNHILIQIHIKK